MPGLSYFTPRRTEEVHVLTTASPKDTYDDFAHIPPTTDVNGSTPFMQKILETASTNPSLDVITSNQDLRWLVQSSLWTQKDASWETSPKLPNGDQFSRSSEPLFDCCYTRPRNPGATNRMRTKVPGCPLIKVSQEEAERRRLRRERNRMAAAKCRNRRRELTDTLQNESNELESAQSQLQEEISRLEREKEKLELVLQVHRPICKITPPSPPAGGVHHPLLP